MELWELCRFGTSLREFALSFLLLVLMFSGLKLVKSRKQRPVSVTSVVGGLPKKFVRPAAPLLDVGHRRTVVADHPGESSLREVGGLAKCCQTFAQGTAQLGDDLRLSRHVFHASQCLDCGAPFSVAAGDSKCGNGTHTVTHNPRQGF